MTGFEELSDVEVAEEITTWAGRVAAGEARLLALISEFDRREAWAEVGMLSCAHWLSWRLGLGLKAAHERVRVARALIGLPVTASAFGRGRLSWSQVRAITRVATPEDEETYVGLARFASGAQLERLIRGVRRALKPLEDAADPELAAHRMRTRVSYDVDGTLVLTVRLPAEQGAVVLAALEQARAELDRQRRPAPAGDGQSSAEDAPGPRSSAGATAGRTGTEASGARGRSSAEDWPALCDAPTEGAAAAGGGSARPVPATLAEAVLHLATTSLRALATSHPDIARRHRARLVAHIDPLTGWGRLADGELLPPGAAPALTGRLRRLTAVDLTADDLGRTARLPTLALREHLGAIDGERCRYPACTRHRRLHAHHVQPWSAGGPTDLANLLLLCPRHHTVVHHDGFALTLHPDRTLTVATNEGQLIPHHPPLPWQPAAGLPAQGTGSTASTGTPITAITLPPTPTGDRLNLAYAVGVLTQHAA